MLLLLLSDYFDPDADKIPNEIEKLVRAGIESVRALSGTAQNQKYRLNREE